ncbi:Uncharacterised protein [uncultured archaeon]|nr:Uncharacterised protein [uncultured archaeon]
MDGRSVENNPKGPVYKVAIKDGPGSPKDILIDVTKSEPHWSRPGKDLEKVLRETLRMDGVGDVLDFGAGKLRNDPFVLANGKSVCAVEFEEASFSETTKANLAICKRHKERFRLIDPDKLQSDRRKFDLVLLINVVPTMPLLNERLEVLRMLGDKLRDGKYLLWFAQQEGKYRKIREAGRNECADGIWLGNGREFKSFYRYHPIGEVDRMMLGSGLEPFRRLSAGDNDAKIYKKA